MRGFHEAELARKKKIMLSTTPFVYVLFYVNSPIPKVLLNGKPRACKERELHRKKKEKKTLPLSKKKQYIIFGKGYFFSFFKTINQV